MPPLKYISDIEVVVVGDWNGWDPLVNRLNDTDGEGIWEIETKLQRGKEYRYQFLIDLLAY